MVINLETEAKILRLHHCSPSMISLLWLELKDAQGTDELENASGRHGLGLFTVRADATVGGASQFDQVWLSSGSGRHS